METVLITGGTGFFGRNLALRLRPYYNTILSGRNAYFNDYAKRKTGCEVIPLNIADVNSIRAIIKIYRPDIIIHAAATKYVDLAEEYPNDCIDINIKGAQNIIDATLGSDVKLVIGVSSDKAALPCNNLYGMSKSIMEKLFLSMDRQAGLARWSCVRMGNIAWSTGSVLPAWKNMLAEKRIIQTTGSHMRRFIFSVDEACEMMLDALDNREMITGKILTRRMKAVSIASLLDSFVAVYGGTYEKVPARPGESTEQFIIGDEEINRTSSIKLNNNEYLLIHKKDISSPGINESISTANCEMLSGYELAKIIDPSPNSYI